MVARELFSSSKTLLTKGGIEMTLQKKGFNRREFLGLTGTAICGASLLGFPRFSMAENPKRGGEINIGIQNLPNGYDPGRYVGLLAQRVLSFSHDGLVDLVSPDVITASLKQGKPVEEIPVVTPNLAERWEISKDGLDYTFFLARDVLFHNGKEFKAEDVEYCIKRVLSKPIGSSSASKFKYVDKITVLDDHTIRLTLKTRMAPFISFVNMSLPIYPKDSHPMDKLNKVVSKEKPPAAGTGPFKWVDWKPGAWVRYERFENYRKKGLPYLDAVTIKKVSEATVRYTGLRTGELDFIASVPFPAMAKMVQKSPKKKDVYFKQKDITVYVSDYNLLQYLALNMRQKPFDDIRVRKAFALAMDRDKIALGATYGLGGPEEQSYSRTTSVFYLDGLDWYEQDLEQAKKLLKESGYGSGMEVECLVQPTNQLAMGSLNVYQQQLKKIGVTLKLKTLRRAGFFPLVRKQKFQMTTASLGTYNQFDLDGLYDYLYSWNKSKNWRNRAGYNNEEMDRLLAEGQTGSSLRQRRKTYRKVYDLIKRDIPYIPIAGNSVGWGWRNTLKGFSPTAAIPPFRGFYNAWTDKT